jgi:hypothetical protein
MAFKMVRVDVYHAEVPDQVGGIASKLKPLADAGTNLEYVYSQRSLSKPGTGDLFVAPVVGHNAQDAARSAGLQRVQEPIVMRVEGDDKAGLSGRLTIAWEKAGLNLHSMTMSAIQGKFIGYVTFDTADDANRAAIILSELGNQ